MHTNILHLWDSILSLSLSNTTVNESEWTKHENVVKELYTKSYIIYLYLVYSIWQKILEQV